MPNLQVRRKLVPKARKEVAGDMSHREGVLIRHPSAEGTEGLRRGLPSLRDFRANETASGDSPPRLFPSVPPGLGAM